MYGTRVRVTHNTEEVFNSGAIRDYFDLLANRCTNFLHCNSICQQSDLKFHNSRI
jgi:hypothetical protein